MSANGSKPMDSSLGPSNSSTSLTLLERVRLRDEDAWRRFVDLYGPLVYSWCRRLGLDADDSQDVVQNTFGTVASRIDAFRPDRSYGTFRGWLWTIARHEAIEHFRRVQRSPKPVGGTDMQVWLANVPRQCPEGRHNSQAEDERIGLLRRAVQVIRRDFQAQTWVAFERTAMRGESAANVAEDLGMTKRAVRQAKYRVLQRLREEFGDLIEP